MPIRLFAALVALAAAPRAQTPDWGALTLAGGLVVPEAGGYGAAWRNAPGGAAVALAPAYGGRARAALVVHHADNRAEGVPAFLAVTPTVGWGPSVRVGRAALAAGAEVGVAYLRFEDDDAFGGNLQNETEALVGAWARADARLTGPVGVWAEGGVQRIAFASPQTLASVRAGVAVTVATPRWLRDVLR